MDNQVLYYFERYEVTGYTVDNGEYVDCWGWVRVPHSETVNEPDVPTQKTWRLIKQTTTKEIIGKVHKNERI